MEEKVIIKGNAQGIKAIPWLLVIVGFLVGVVASWVAVEMAEDYMIFVFIPLGIALFVWGIVLFFYVSSCEICVTDKRVYGKAAFGARVDLPIDSVSAVGTISLYKGIFISSSSGKIKFLYISNADNIHAAISKMLVDRQEKVVNILQETKSNVEELKKYKDLLDSGIISQEEFDIKKKQILDL